MTPPFETKLPPDRPAWEIGPGTVDVWADFLLENHRVLFAATALRVGLERRNKIRDSGKMNATVPTIAQVCKSAWEIAGAMIEAHPE